MSPGDPASIGQGGWLRVIERYSFGGWVFCALVAILRPDDLSDSPLRLPVHVRTDTLGAVFFAVAAMATVPRRWLSVGRTWRGRLIVQGADAATSPHVRTAPSAVFAAVRDFSLAVAVYIGANYLNHPETMRLPLTHLASWPSERVTGGVAFGLAVLANLALEVTGRRRPARAS